MIIAELEKPNDRVPKEIIWLVHNKKNVPQCCINIIENMYKGAMTSVDLSGEISKFSLTIE